MSSIDDNARKIHSIKEVAGKLGIKNEKLIYLALKLKLNLLISPPEDTEFYLISNYKNNFSAKNMGIESYQKLHPQEQPLRVDLDGHFLCLTPSNYKSIISTGFIKQKEFSLIVMLGENSEITTLNSINYRYDYLKLKRPLSYSYETFNSFHKEKQTLSTTQKKPTNEKTVTINLDELFITADDLRLIEGEQSNNEPYYGKFKTEEWTPKKLAQLNEASTLFFSGGQDSVAELSEGKKEEIKNWFLNRWDEGTGQNPLRQAVNAILPDRFYRSPPTKGKIDEALRCEYNDYASTVLIIVNESAIKYLKPTDQNNKKNFPKWETVSEEIKETWGLRRRLSDAIATIISPDSKKK